MWTFRLVIELSGNRTKTLLGSEQELKILRDALLAMIDREYAEILTAHVENQIELIPAVEVERVGLVEPFIAKKPDGGGRS